MDDAANRRLGNGAKFYGKRKSSFYGEDDEYRKADPNAFNREEDYSGPLGGSYFTLSKERDEQGRPMGFLTKKQAREQREAEEAERWARMREDQLEDQLSEDQLMRSFSDAVSRERDE